MHTTQTVAPTKQPLRFLGGGRLAVMLAVLAQPALAQDQAQPKFLAPILMAAISPVLQSGFGCLFERMFSFLGANPSPACTQPNQTAMLRPGEYYPQGMPNPAMAGYGQPPGMAGYGQPPGAPPSANGNWNAPPGSQPSGGGNWNGPPGSPPATTGNWNGPPGSPPTTSSSSWNGPPGSPPATSSSNWNGPPGAPPVTTATWGGPPIQTSPMSKAQALQLAETPVFSFIVNKLTDGSAQAGVKQTVQFNNISQNAQNLGFDIRTGESFAILFATTVPGRVRMINTDVDRVVSSSDVYEALPAADNRMPRDWQGGITMAGKKGVEYLDIDFTPCISQQYVNDPRVTQFQGLLPPCTVEAATKQFTPALAGGRGGVADSGAKAMIFPQSPNPGQPVAIAPANYSKGGALTFRMTINHR